MFSAKQLTRMAARQEEMNEQLRTFVAALIAGEPRTGLAAEAYEGLRKTIVVAAQDRRRQLAQLVAISDAIERGASIDTLRQRCEEWCMEAGLRRHTDAGTAEPDWFDVVEGDGPRLEVIEPAWVDSASGVVVKQGVARRTAAADPPPAASPDGDTTDTGRTESDAAPGAPDDPDESATEGRSGQDGAQR